ncbi:hypothetical protein [Roseovarius aquimarinus]|uniref:Uncharacterized protein n=1 Tax=Roseovarius aquimarinus TaxID=1229156 RepID=A0ABW7I2G1_9RHOB
MTTPPTEPMTRLRDALRAMMDAPLRLRGRRGALGSADLDRLSRHIILPTVAVTDEEIARAAFQDRGTKLARQEMWDDLARLIAETDAARAGTPGGESASLLLAFGARSDVVAMTEDALHDGAIPDLDGIDAMEALVDEFAGDYPVAAVVALAHIDMAWAWRAIPGASGLDGAAIRAAHHAARAEALLAPHVDAAGDAPSVAAARCALLRAQPGHGAQHVADRYQHLIDIDPASPRHMRGLGAAVLAAMPGDYRALELEARRTAARTGDIWGAGAYAWVYLDALALDPGALCLLDPAFFIDGLRDILARRRDQHTANLLAAFCAITMRPDTARRAPVIPARDALHACLPWLLRDHLQELHPLIWTQALHRPGAGPLPPRRALLSEGRRTALRAIAAQFADDIAQGQSIAFSPAGMYMLPSL